MIKKVKKGKHVFFIGILKRFQGLGCMFSSDNAIVANEYFLFEIRLLWLRFWYVYEFFD